MNSVANARNKEVSDFRYNFQHLVLVSKYRFKVFKNPKTQKVVVDAFREVEERFTIQIKELSFGDDYAHVHMEVNVPSKLSMEQVVQLFKSHSSSKVFAEMPNFIKRYPRKSFWGGQPTGTSVGPVGENVIRDYIRRQDVSYEPFLKYEEQTQQRKLFAM